MTTDAEPGLTLADFEPRIGTAFTVETAMGAQALELVAAVAIPQSPRPEGGFRLEFAGPAQPRLPQGIYRFPLGDTAHDIFIVASGFRIGGGLSYEAVFF